MSLTSSTENVGAGRSAEDNATNHKRKQKACPLCFCLKNSCGNEQNPFQLHQREMCHPSSRAAVPRPPHAVKGVGGSRTGSDMSPE